MRAVKAVAYIAYVASLFWIVNEARALRAQIPEIALDPIVVEMADPFPCVSDARERLTMQRLGVVCRPWPVEDR